MRMSSIAYAAEYWLAPERFFARTTRLGDRFLFNLPGAVDAFCVTHPDDVKKVFTASNSTLQLTPAMDRFTPHHAVFGEHTLISMEGEEHLTNRRYASPPFRGKALKTYEEAMVRLTEKALAAWPMGEEVSFRDRSGPIALDIVAEVMFGVNDQQRGLRVRDAAIAWLDSIRSTRLAIQTAWATSRGGKWTGNYDTITNARLAVEALVQEEIDERRRAGNDGRDDVLGIMLSVRDDEGDPLLDIALREQIAGLLIAGYETTSQALSWLGNDITRLPELLERLTESAQGDDPEWIDATIHEVLRLHPPVMFNIRYVAERFAFDDGVELEPGRIVMPFTYTVHRRPDLYPEPERFLPERFIGKRPKTYEWIPFGGGTRRCLGAAFSLFEVRVILRTILRHARFRVATTPVEPPVRMNISLVPKRGGRVVLDRA
ncbi:cytochrome P450 [Mycobacterium sp.]|uniref:cytochrome P450 n=1 Tax=Mycobacterium sp. TaxID=1785 RepID=UPI003C71E995